MFNSLLPSVYRLKDVLGMNTCFWCQGLNKMIWILDCQIDNYYPRWSSVGSRTCKQYFSIQNFIPLLLWSWLVLLSTHFVKQSIATSKNFTCFSPCDKGPIMSIPHYANGQGEDMVVIFSLRARWTFLYLWHLSHFLTKSAVSCCILGQK